MTDINSRKADHIALASDAKHQAAQGSGFDRLRFEPNPLPQMSLDDIQLDGDFLGRPVAAPFLIGAMTGGCNNGELINKHLAEAAQACNIPMALGSQRASLEEGMPQESRLPGGGYATVE
jgi:isopentenyl-diphosphate delta-isomerase